MFQYLCALDKYIYACQYINTNQYYFPFFMYTLSMWLGALQYVTACREPTSPRVMTSSTTTPLTVTYTLTEHSIAVLFPDLLKPDLLGTGKAPI